VHAFFDLTVLPWGKPLACQLRKPEAYATAAWSSARAPFTPVH
jgi:hypothetical protein